MTGGAMKTIIVLAMHGVPPNDFPRREMAEFFELHGRMEMSPAGIAPDARHRYRELERRVRRWPRTSENDPYHAAALELGQALRKETGFGVVVGFNEFCAPDVGEAIGLAAEQSAGRIVVLTTMMTRGGEHAEREIAQAVAKARTEHPAVEIIYAWPFETPAVARFLAEHVRKFIPEA
jgi:sirohydrochlorin cobaltochelatase